jgi:hypothetical protein
LNKFKAMGMIATGADALRMIELAQT